MKHKTWFRLVLQAIGVLLVAWSAPDLIGRAGTYLIWRYQQAGLGLGTPPGRAAGVAPEWLSFLVQVLPSMLELAIGIYLMTGAKWLLDKFIPSNRPYCPECGYDLTHNAGPKCSECGVTLPAEFNREAEPQQASE